jgi:hypothetical protein
MDQPFDPKLPLDVVAEDWGCTVRHIRDLEKAGKIRLMRLSKRMCRMPLSEKLRYEKSAQNAAADAEVGKRLRLAREAVA